MNRKIAALGLLIAALAGMHGLARAGDAKGAEDPGAVPEGRLPDWVTPVRYRIDLTLVPARTRFTGHVEIDAHLNRATDHFFIDGRDLAMHRAEVWSGKQCYRVAYTQVDPLGVARIDLPRRLGPGDIRLVFDYDAPFGDTTVGVFHLQEDRQWYAWSYFEPLDARRAFPGFDQPGYKTPFDISIATLPGLVAVSNSPETGAERAGALVRHRFATTRPLPTYLAAFYAGPFATLSGRLPASPVQREPLAIRVVGTPANRARMPFVLENSKTILGLLENYFGQAFPFPKLDQVGTPILNGGMENAGADLYGGPQLFVGEDSAPAAQGYFGMLVAHELSHQWFGDLVTPKWWDDLWLNESFADWMGYRIANRWRPGLDFGTQAVAGALGAMDIDALDVGRAIHQPIARNQDIAGAFDDITYAKGGQVIAMVAAYLGDTTFRDAVRLHLNRHRYGSADSDDFFQSLADAGHDPRLVDAMRSFVDQPGVPRIVLRHDGDRLRISQEPYTALGTVPTPRRWIVPFCWRELPHGKRQCTLLDKSSMLLPAGVHTPLLPNAGGTGYYRYTMDDADWKELIRQGATLQPAEALTLVDSTWASFRAGQLPFGRLLDLTAVMASHPYGPVAVASAKQLLELRDTGFIDGTGGEAIDVFLRRTYRPLLAKAGFAWNMHVDGKSSAEVRQRRHDIVQVLARAGDDRVSHWLDQAAQAWLRGDTSALAREFYRQAFKAYVRCHRPEDVHALWQRALDSEDPSFRAAAVAAVAGSGDADVAHWLSTRLDDPRLRSTERVSVVLGLLGKPATRQLGRDEILARFHQLEKRTGYYGVVLLGAPKAFCSARDAQAFGDRMLALARKRKLGTLEIERGMELGSQCGELRRVREKDVRDALTMLARQVEPNR